MSKATKELALCGLMTALGVVLLCLGGIIPFALYACPILASAVLVAVRAECRIGYAWVCWAATAALGLLLGPDKEAAALYLFLGYYPLIKPRLDMLRPAAVQWLVKIGLAAAAVGGMYALLLYVLAMQQLVEELAGSAPWVLWSGVAMGAALFVVYDILLGRFTRYYQRRRKSA